MTVPVGIDWRITKTGKCLSGLCGSVALGGNNNHIPALITAVNDTPKLICNGRFVQISPAQVTLPPFEGIDVAQTYQPYVMYLCEYGGVESIEIVNNGLINSTNPLFTLSGGNPSIPAVLSNGGLGTVVNNVIIPPSVINPGKNYQSPPSINITGTDATVRCVMTGPLATDNHVLSYSSNIFSTTVNGVNGSITGGAVFVSNYVGKLEKDGNYSKGFDGPKTMIVGGNIGQQVTQYNGNFPFKNRCKAAGPWQLQPSTISLALDNNNYPATWTPGGTIYSYLFYEAVTQFQGIWTLQYDDDYYLGLNSSTQPQETFLGYGGTNISFTQVGLPVVNDGVVTIQYQFNFTTLNAGGGIRVSLQMTSNPDGLQHVRNPWVFAPGNTIDRSNPYAIDDNVKRWLTNTNGNGPGSMRWMNNTVSPGISNMQDKNDLLDPNMYSWQIPYWFDGNPVLGAPHSKIFKGTCILGSNVITNVNDTSFLRVGDTIVGNGIPGSVIAEAFTTIMALTSNTITLSNNVTIGGIQSLSVNSTPSGRGDFTSVRPWSSNRIYSSSAFAIDGDVFGTYKDTTIGPLGINDNGRVIGGLWADNATGIVEFVSPREHGLKTGDSINIWNRTTNTVDWSVSGSQPLSTWLINTIYVTSETTAGGLVQLGGSGGNTNQTLVAEVPVDIGWFRLAPQSSLPYEATYSFANNWPKTSSFRGTISYNNLPSSGSDEFYADQGRKAAILAPNNDHVIELDNEPWNTGGPGLTINLYLQTIAEMLSNYYPIGTEIYEHYTPAGNTEFYVIDGHQFDVFQIGVLLAAHAHCVFKKAYIAAGGKGSVKVAYSAQYGDIFHPVGAIKAWNLPQDYIVVAPYQDLWNTSINTLDWPRDAMNEITRYHTFYGTELQQMWADFATNLAGTTLQIVGYEGGFQSLIGGGGSRQVDMFYDESFGDTIDGFLRGLQQGHVNIPNSGLVIFNYFQCVGDSSSAMWTLGDSWAMPMSCSQNQFPANQHMQTNGPPGLLALRGWF